jgi:hypothetical protein
LIHEFTRSCRIEVAAKQLADLGGFRVELLDEAPGVVAVADQPWFEFVELTLRATTAETKDTKSEAAIKQLRE